MLRKISAILIGLLVSTNAHAELSRPIAYMTNQDTGRIELYMDKVPVEAILFSEQCMDSLVAKAWGANTNDNYGCWKARDDVITIFWLIGKGVNRTYHTNAFKMTKYGNQLYEGKFK